MGVRGVTKTLDTSTLWKEQNCNFLPVNVQECSFDPAPTPMGSAMFRVPPPKIPGLRVGDGLGV